MIDISDFGAHLVDRTITPNEVITVTDWLEGAASPTYIRQYDSFKTITITIIVEGMSEQDVAYNISQVINVFRAQKVLEFEDMPDFVFPATLDGRPTITRLKPCVMKVELTFKGNYMRTRQETTITPDISSGSFTFTVGGTAPTPLKFELTPIASTIVKVEVAGLLKGGFTIRNVPYGKSLVIDTENGEVNLVDTITGEATPAIDCYQDAWSLPILDPGTYVVTLDYYSGYNLKFSFNENYV